MHNLTPALTRKPHWDPVESLHCFTWFPQCSPVSLARVGDIQQSWLGFEPEGSVVFVGFSMQQHLFPGRKHQPVPLPCSNTVFAWQCYDWWVAVSPARHHNDSLLIPMLPQDRQHSQWELRPCTPQSTDRRNLSKKAALASFTQGCAKAGKQLMDSDRLSTQTEASMTEQLPRLRLRACPAPGQAEPARSHRSPRAHC